jgi:phage recombination protein Bet
MNQTKQSALAVMASKYSVEAPKLLDTLKSTLMPKASNEEMMAFVLVANSYDLNPFTKEIYAFPNRSGGISPVVSVDGWMKLMNRQPQFDGISFRCEEADGKPVSVTATIYLKDRSRPVEVTEYFAECYRSTEPWKSHPRRMLRHKALIQAARVAFGFSGITDEDEAANVVNLNAEPAKPIFKEPKSAEVIIETKAIEAEKTIQQQLADIVVGAGFTWAAFEPFAVGLDLIEAGKFTTFDDLPDDVVTKCLVAKNGMVRALKGGNK